ncbi:hypothetical protein BC938DRAFT_482609 [Jimgerdemannia flammicorona]|uniref:BHLH domain-containing protein n=1 Tax=Jimgerdemannia flammicorona TaxID=994334 RepID=A0A433QDR3_9FUNG|nr:hypothetical protein BC938DRAFT_482609 [Jimgerdemannia flammicorona]
MSKILLPPTYGNEYILPTYPTTKVELHEPQMYHDFAFSSPMSIPISLTSSANHHDNSPASPESTTSSLPPHTPPSTGPSLSETIAKASTLPDSFYPEFHQYSKETYEQSTSASRKRRRCGAGALNTSTPNGDKMGNNRDDGNDDGSQSSDENEDELDGNALWMNATNMHEILPCVSEQKRRAQIKDGFEDLRKQLPGCLNKKMSKAALLHRTVQHIQHLKNTQITLLAELERLMNENEQLRKFQESLLQKQALEKMYQIGAL